MNKKKLFKQAKCKKKNKVVFFLFFLSTTFLVAFCCWCMHLLFSRLCLHTNTKLLSKKKIYIYIYLYLYLYYKQKQQQQQHKTKSLIIIIDVNNHKYFVKFSSTKTYYFVKKTSILLQKNNNFLMQNAKCQKTSYFLFAYISTLTNSSIYSIL